MNSDPFAFLYKVDDRDRALFGWRYAPEKDVFEYGVPMKVAEFPARNADGQNCVLFETRVPARFFELRVEGGSARPAVIITTGSGDEVGRLLIKMAEQIAAGMLGFKVQ